MLLEEAILKAKTLIYSDSKHIDYQRALEIDKDALIYTTGENIGEKIIQVVKREGEEAFKQRIAIYGGITTELFGSLEIPINDVLQNDMVRKGIRLDNERQRLAIEEKYKRWGGGSLIESGGWENWQTTRYKDLHGHSPNTWIVCEWETPQSAADIIYAQPFEVPAEWAYNFELENDKKTAKWLWVAQPIKYLKKKAAEEVKQTVTVSMPDGNKWTPDFPLPEYLQHISQDGKRYTLYTDTDSIVFEQIDKGYYEQQSNDLAIEQIKSSYYVVRVYPHKLGFVPAFRIGFLDDPFTSGRTKVPFWHRAKAAFKDSVLKVSQMDIAELVQNFARPTRYVTQCQGTPAHACNKGYEAGTTERKLCGACKGSGMQTITTPQEEIIIPLPVDATNENMIDLSKLTHWDAPPQAPFEHMREVIKDITPRAHRAVWGTDMLIRTETTTKTATEDDNDQRQIQTALSSFARHVSWTYRFVAYVFAGLSAADMNKLSVYYEFQGELYRRGKAQILAQRKFAIESSAPVDVINQLDDLLLDIINAGDPYGRQMATVQKYFRPFAGMSQAQIEYAIETGRVENFYVVLWANYDAIFKEIVLEIPGFYYEPNKNVQWALIEAKVKEFIDLKQKETPEPTLPTVPLSVQ